MAFLHPGHVCEQPLERPARPRGLGDEDERRDAGTDQRWVDRRLVAGDDAAGLELLDPLMRGGGGHPDPGADVRVRRSSFTLKDLDDRPVGGGELGSGHESADDIAGTITAMDVLTTEQLSQEIGELGNGWEERGGTLHKEYAF